jgi:2-oxoglutarate ferredoxin oxidoreductase subunit beta
VDSDRKHLTSILTAAAEHRGASFIEIYQNCPIFNDDAFEAVKDRDSAVEAIIPLTHGEPILFGVDKHLGVVRDGATGDLKVAEVAEVGLENVIVHDENRDDPSYAFGLSRLTTPGVLERAPIGIFRKVDAPAYDDLAREQVTAAQDASAHDSDALQAMINGSDTWSVS